MDFAKEFGKRFAIGCAVYVGTQVAERVHETYQWRKVKREMRKAAKKAIEEYEKNIVDIDDYEVYPA